MRKKSDGYKIARQLAMQKKFAKKKSVDQKQHLIEINEES